MYICLNMCIYVMNIAFFLSLSLHSYRSGCYFEYSCVWYGYGLWSMVMYGHITRLRFQL